MVVVTNGRLRLQISVLARLEARRTLATGFNNTMVLGIDSARLWYFPATSAIAIANMFRCTANTCIVVRERRFCCVQVIRDGRLWQARARQPARAGMQNSNSATHTAAMRACPLC